MPCPVPGARWVVDTRKSLTRQRDNVILVGWQIQKNQTGFSLKKYRMQTSSGNNTIAQSRRNLVLAAVAVAYAVVGICPANIAFGQCGSYLQHFSTSENSTQIEFKGDAHTNSHLASRNPSLPCNGPDCRSAPTKSTPSPMVAPSSVRQSITTANPLLMIETSLPAVSLSRFSLQSGWRMAGFLDSVDRPPIALNV
jgi:hypothetical protein